MFLRGRRLVSPSHIWPGMWPCCGTCQAADPPGSQFIVLVAAPVARPHPSCLSDQKCINTLGDSLLFPGWTVKYSGHGATASKGEGKHKPGKWTQILQTQPQIHTRLVIKNRNFSQNYSVRSCGVKKPWVFFSVNQWRDQCGDSCASLVKLLSLVFGCLQE